MTSNELMERVRDATLEMPGSRKSIAEFLMREGGGVANLSMAEVAELTFCSKPSLVRFAKAMGFAGWRTFRYAFVLATRESEAFHTGVSSIDLNHPFGPEDALSSVVNNVSLLEQRAVGEAAAQTDEATLREAAHRVLDARRCVFLGAEPNNFFGELFAYKLRQIGLDCQVPTEDEWAAAVRGLGPDDCAILASYSGVGEHRPPVSFASTLNGLRVPLVAITNSGSNWLREQSDCVLSFEPRERYYSKISGYYSEQCVRFMLDALFSACFAADYERNEMARLRMLIAYERKLHQKVDDVLPS